MATIQVKAIVPKRFNTKTLLAEVAKEMKNLQKDIGEDFDATVSTWKHKPKFDQEFQQSAKSIRTFTGTSDEIYTYVSKGTRAHLIRPKRAKMLAFQGGIYTAKSMPGVLQARSGGPSGDMVYSRGVKHPGTKARNFDEAIAKKWEKSYLQRLTTAVNRGVKSSGHAMK